MKTHRRTKRRPGGVLTALAIVLAFCAFAPVFAQQPTGAQPGQGEFVPIDQLPPSEQLPAAPLLIGAYAFVWVTLLVYVWSVRRRLGRVEGEIAALARQTTDRTRSL